MNVAPALRWRSGDLAPVLVLPLLALVALPMMSFSTWLTFTIAGIAMGMMLFLMASGLTLIFGLMDVLNFAHGAFITLGYKSAGEGSRRGNASFAVVGDGAVPDAIRAAMPEAYIVGTLREAIERSKERPSATFVTLEGDIVRGPLIVGGRALPAFLIFPVSRDAFFGDAVHFFGSDLDFESEPAGPDHRGVQ